MRIIVSGAIGRSVTGGQAWANLQYLIGLRDLGHDVYYLEDCGGWSVAYDWEAGQPTWDIAYPAAYVERCLASVGFADNWIYRAGAEARGLSFDELSHICARADLLLIRGVPFLEWRPEYDLPRRRAFIDVDPGFTQIRLTKCEPAFADTLGRCEVLLTVGHHVGEAGCDIPTGGRDWKKTVPPVVLDQWPVAQVSDRGAFTTIVRWRGLKDVEYAGIAYGQRDRELRRFINLPRLTAQALQIALTGGGDDECAAQGWDVVPGWKASRTVESYRSYITTSRAELSVAKHGYVATAGGWFSDRSVCYLAAGRPVLVQDTGLTSWLPVGQGLLTFTDVREALAGIEDINADYSLHRRAARRLAEEYFAAPAVLSELLHAIEAG